jgi:hypothetical protein
MDRNQNHGHRIGRHPRSKIDSDISSFVYLPNLPDWVVVSPNGPDWPAANRVDVEIARTEVDVGLIGI